jgi:hypothetical protein
VIEDEDDAALLNGRERQDEVRRPTGRAGLAVWWVAAIVCVAAVAGLLGVMTGARPLPARLASSARLQDAYERGVAEAALNTAAYRAPSARTRGSRSAQTAIASQAHTTEAAAQTAAADASAAARDASATAPEPQPVTPPPAY